MAHLSTQRSPGHSFIPVVAPRLSPTAFATGPPVPQVSLGPQPRRPSETPSRASAASTPASPGPHSSIPSFRSLRNLLSFGPSKNSHSAGASPNAPRPSFVGSLRRSINHERRGSTTLALPDDSEKFSVIAIAHPSDTFEEEMMAHKRSRDMARSASGSAVPSRTWSAVDHDRYVLPVPSPVPPLGADLSTIIEAENSGISKHIPCLDDSARSEARSSSPDSAFCFDERNQSRHQSPESRHASVLNLSTSRLNAEVMDALMVEDATSASEWLQSVDGAVMEETNDDTPRALPRGHPSGAEGEADADTTLDFGVLDPDLSQLLSPHRLNGKPHRPAINGKASSLWSLSRGSSHLLAPSPHIVSGLEHRASPRLALVVPSSSRAVAQSSPQRRSMSLSRSALARPVASSLPRLTRSVTATPPTSNPSPKEPTLHALQKKRHQPPSPLSSQAHSTQSPSPVNPHMPPDVLAKRLVGSRLGAVNRHVSAYTPSSSLTDLRPSPENTSPSSDSQVSSRTVSDTQQHLPPRPSVDLASTLDVNKRRRAHLLSNRKRSMSVEEARMSATSASTRVSPIRPSSSLSNRPPATEWLGPRTVKAFAAAGLLDVDRDGGGTNALGRHGSSRGSNEDRYVPSRMAFSEAASTSSWGRSGSISRVMTPSEGGVTWAGSPTFSCPRTTLSGGSTAPTSVSASSSVHQATIQLMKEKHDLETEALLGALSDSQRTTKTLREENAQLRDRIQELEDELDALRDQLRRLANGVPSARPAPQAALGGRPVLDRKISSTPGALAAGGAPSSCRPALQSAHSLLAAPSPSPSSSSGGARSAVEVVASAGGGGSGRRERSRTRSPALLDPLLHVPRPHGERRGSTTSSIFPSVPSNMSLLMLEESVHCRETATLSSTSVSPRSPSRCLPLRTNGGGSCKTGYAGRLSPVSTSGDNVSPATAEFSLTEVPGSPTSLHLRPEHELHLGDRASLSLYAMSDDEGQTYDL